MMALRKGRITRCSASQGIESIELKDFEAQWRPLIRGSIILFLFGLVAYFMKTATFT